MTADKRAEAQLRATEGLKTDTLIVASLTVTCSDVKSNIFEI